MKFKSYVTMTMALMAFVLGVCSCGSDNDEPEVPVASQVAGSYTGNEVIKVMGEISSEGTSTYEIVKSTDVSVDMTIPEAGSMGPMVIPALPVKNIPLTKSGETITGKLASYSGKVTNSKGEEKAYTISDVTIIFSGKTVVVTFSLKYGNMPMSMDTTFTGTRQ